MKTVYVWFAFALCAAVVRPATAEDAAPVGLSVEETAIRTNADKYVEAYNRRDSEAMASMWLPEAVYMIRSTGESITGRDAIASYFVEMLADSEDAKLAVTIESIDFVSPNVAIEKGIALVSYTDNGPEEMAYSAVHVKRDGQWLLDRVSEESVPEPPNSHYEHLQDLEWMVGSWVDGDGQASIQTEVAWTKNRNFLRRSFAVVIGDQVNMSGIQVIGWDEAEKQVRSWVFDSDGGFSEATWTNKEGKWFIQNNGTLSDGRKVTSLNVVTPVDNDSFGWESVNRIVDGQLMPNIAQVTVVRADADVSAEVPE